MTTIPTHPISSAQQVCVGSDGVTGGEPADSAATTGTSASTQSESSSPGTNKDGEGQQAHPQNQQMPMSMPMPGSGPPQNINTIMTQVRISTTKTLLLNNVQ